MEDRLIGESPAMHRLRESIRLAAQGQEPVLIVGETGTGKELVARSLHQQCCPDGRMVCFACGATPMHSFEGWLIGSEPRSWGDDRFTGALKLAEGGMVFLDGITEIDSAGQACLLRVLEQQEFSPLGGTRIERLSARLVASTVRDLDEEVRKGRFRSDLHHRLRTFVLHVPPLRERLEDLPALTAEILAGRARTIGRPVPKMREEIVRFFSQHDWPGNVRELASACELWVVWGDDARPEDLIRRGTRPLMALGRHRL